MHEYYKNNSKKFRKMMNDLLKHIKPELEKASGKPYDALLEEIWGFYEKNLMENFTYIGGDSVSGTKNLTGAYCFVAMGEVLKEYGVGLEEIGHLMVISYERFYSVMPKIVKAISKKMFSSPKMATKSFKKKDAKNAANAKLNPGSFETETMAHPDEGYDFSYHNLVCPLSDFAKKYGYGEYMPYLCNLDYVMLKVFDVPLYRTQTCYEDGTYCNFNVKLGAPVLDAWPPVFEQDNPYK